MCLIVRTIPRNTSCEKLIAAVSRHWRLAKSAGSPPHYVVSLADGILKPAFPPFDAKLNAPSRTELT